MHYANVLCNATLIILTPGEQGKAKIDLESSSERGKERLLHIVIIVFNF